MLILAAIVEHSPYCNYRPIAPWYSTAMAEFQQPEFRVTKTWNSVNERNSGNAKEVETLFLAFRLRLKWGLWYYSYTIVRLTSAIVYSHYPKHARSQATTNQPGVRE